MSVDMNQTRILLEAIERSYQPTTLLLSTFFPNPRTFVTEEVDIEYKKGNRAMAPFVAPASSGVNMARVGSTMKSYKPPKMMPKRPISVENLNKRGFGEELYSTRTPAQREAELRANDMAELSDMNTRRGEWMAAQLLTLGTFTAKGYSDDGVTYVEDTFTLDWTQKDTLTGSDTWDNAGADIYGDMTFMSRTVSTAAGMVPTIAVCSFATGDYILKNTAIKEYLLRPKENLSLMSIAPRIQSPEVIRIGIIESLNLEMFAYNGLYLDDDGTNKQYIPDDYFIMGIPGRGRQLYGAITQMDNDEVFRTYEGRNVPKVWSEKGKDVRQIRMASAMVPLPEDVNDWYTLKVK
ncbi:major capsid protein [Anaeroselena agilis]|uniref:Major capsid protein n=1 Tax=Anaeroselena agilis TaxID=3063788 RepID=A0ABU3NYH0_9FIRM|nr:major capsid protein [Selenomonadales bacterium 4137-cl]